MSLSIADIVRVSIAVAPNPVSVAGFGPLMFVSKDYKTIPAQATLVQVYTSMKDLTLDYPDGEVNKAASAWFGQSPIPQTFMVAPLTSTSAPATPGTLVGTGAAVVANVKAITNGVLSIAVDGVTHDLTDFDFSSIVDISAATSVLNSKLTGIASASQIGGIFTITSITTGTTSLVESPIETGTPAVPEVPATSGKLLGTAAAVLTDIKAVTAGKLDITIDGTVVHVTALNLSAVTDLPAAASALQAKLTGKATVTQAAGVFTITSATTGLNSTVSAPTEIGANATEEVATAFKLVGGTATPGTALIPATKDTRVATALKLVGGLSTPGTAAQSILTDLALTLEGNNFYYYLALDRSVRDTADQLDAGGWAQANSKVMGLVSEELNFTSTQHIFARSKAKAYSRVINVYAPEPTEYPEVSILGRAATVNFNVANSSLILAFKKGPGITTANLSPAQQRQLDAVNGNAFLDAGGNQMFYTGKMCDGTWFDTVQGVDWLTEQIRANVFNLFYTSTTKIPWTDYGVALVNHQVTMALEKAVTNGLIAPGYDNEGVFYPTGYKVISTPLELMQSQKGARIWEGTSFIAIGSGAIQGAVITGNFIQ